MGTLSSKEIKYSTCVLGHKPWMHKTMSMSQTLIFIKKVSQVSFVEGSHFIQSAVR